MHVSEENKVKEVTKKKRILVVHNYYQIPGGEDTVVANEIKLLQEHGHEVFFYSRNNSELKSYSKLQKLFLPVNTVFNSKTYKEIKNLIREKNIDLVHVHNTLNLVSPSVYYAAVSCKVPVVQTVHNFRLVCPAATFYRDGHICEECVEKGLSCAVNYNCYRDSKLQTLACVISTKIHRVLGIYHKLNYICLAEFNKEKLLQVNSVEKKEIINPQKVFVKPNMTFEQIKKTVCEKDNYYLFAGRVEKIKGMDVLLEAFSKCPTERLIVAGTGTQLEYYQKAAKEREIHNVEFIGFMEKPKLQELMQRAKAVIVPSQWYETFGMTVIEAFALGTPVIGADIGNLSSLIKNGVNGWKFRYDSADDLAEKIVECSCTKEEDLNVQCDENFFPEGNYQQLLRIYECVAKNEKN